MNSSLIGKIDKAKRYAEQKHRIHFTDLEVNFDGDNDAHRVSLHEGRWYCSCDFFGGWGVCSHTMAIERVLDGMLPREARNQEQRQAASTS